MDTTLVKEVQSDLLAEFVGRDFLNTADFSVAAVQELVERALGLKRQGWAPLLAGQVIGLVFFNPSLRTKTSMASGIAQLGGIALDLSSGQGSYTFEYEDGVVM